MIDLQARWVPTQEEFDAFARVSGDDNPIHTDPEFSARTGFGRTVSHGMLIYSKLWALLKSECPDAVHIHQNMMFPNPTYVGDQVTLRVKEVEQGRLRMVASRDSDEAELLVGLVELAG